MLDLSLKKRNPPPPQKIIQNYTPHKKLSFLLLK